jgi:hypothetical protein
MAFLYPAFLLGAIAIAIPVVLHLLRRDVAPEVPFSAVRLLRRSPIDRSRRRTLKDLLLLAARVAALALLALAFARPYMSTATAAPGLRIIAIDRSFSMDAPGRFAHALELAATAIGESGAGERVAVVAFDDRADVVAAPGSASDARAALATLKTGFGGTRFAPAIAKAIELAGGQRAHLVLISDLQRGGWEDEQKVAVPATLDVDVRDAGALPPNAAVVDLRVEPERVVGTISNSGSAPYAGVARVAVAGREVASLPISVPPEDTADVAIPYRAPRSGAMSLSIDDPKGFGADNTRYVIVDPVARTRVLIVTTAGAPQPGVYIAGALEAAEEQGFGVRVVSGAEASAMSSADSAGYSAIVLLSTRGLDRRGRVWIDEYVKRGGGLLVAAGADVEPEVLSSAFGWSDVATVAEIETPSLQLAASDLRHPIFRPFGASAANLGQVRFDRIWKLKPVDWEVAARFADGSPALVERHAGKGRAMIFASDVDRRWNEFPLHPTFVPFAVETVRYVANLRERGRDYLVAEAPAGTGPAPGIYTTSDRRTVAVNVDARESGGGRLTSREFSGMFERSTGSEGPGSRIDRLHAQNVESRQNLWQYGLILMLGVLVVESAVGRG